MKTAVWAINPFDLETRPSAADLASEERGEWVRRYVPAVEAEMTRYLKGIELPKLKLPRVLVQHSGATREAIAILDRYARDTNRLRRGLSLRQKGSPGFSGWR